LAEPKGAEGVFAKIGDFFKNIYEKMENSYYTFSDWLSSKGIPLDRFDEFLESKGIPPMPVVFGVLAVVVFLLIFFVVGKASYVVLAVEVINQETSLPLAGAEVTLSGIDCTALTCSGFTDAQGRVSFKVPGKKTITISARYPEYVSDSEVVNLREKRRASLFLKPAKLVSFRIRLVDYDSGGQITSGSVFVGEEEIFADTEGLFNLGRFPEGEFVPVNVVVPGYQEEYTNLNATEEILELAIKKLSANLGGRNATLAVYVKDKEGNNIDEAVVKIYDKISREFLGDDETLDGVAYFEVENGKSVRAVVEKEGFALYNSLDMISDADKSKIINGFTEWSISLERLNTELRLNIRDEDKTAILGAEVRIYDANGNLLKETSFSSSAISDGFLSIRGLDGRRAALRVVVFREGHLPMIFETDGNEERNITLLRATSENSAWLEVSVRKENTFVGNAEVTLFLNNLPLAKGRTDISGKITFRNLPIGIRAKIVARLDAETGEYELTLRQGQNIAEIFLGDGGGILKINIENKTQQEFRASIKIISFDGLEVFSREITEETNELEITLLGGEYTLFLSGEGIKSLEKKIMVEAGKVGEETIVVESVFFEPVGRISISLEEIENTKDTTLERNKDYFVKFRLEAPQDGNGFALIYLGEPGVVEEEYVVDAIAPGKKEFGTSFDLNNFEAREGSAFSQNKNKWVKIYFETGGVKEFRVKVHVGELDSLKVNYMTSFFVDGKELRDPQKELGFKTESFPVLSAEEASCMEDKCVEIFIKDEFGNLGEEFSAYVGKIYILSVRTLQKASVDLQGVNVKFENNKKTMSFALEGEREVRFKTERPGLAIVRVKARLSNGKTVRKEIRFKVYEKAALFVSLNKELFVFGKKDNLVINIKNEKGNTVEDALISIESEKNPNIVLQGNGAEKKGLNGQYVIENISTMKGKLLVKIEARGYDRVERTIDIRDREVLVLEPVYVNLEGLREKEINIRIKNNSDFDITNIVLRLEGEEFTDFQDVLNLRRLNFITEPISVLRAKEGKTVKTRIIYLTAKKENLEGKIVVKGHMFNREVFGEGKIVVDSAALKAGKGTCFQVFPETEFVNLPNMDFERELEFVVENLCGKSLNLALRIEGSRIPGLNVVPEPQTLSLGEGESKSVFVKLKVGKINLPPGTDMVPGDIKISFFTTNADLKKDVFIKLRIIRDISLLIVEPVLIKTDLRVEETRFGPRLVGTNFVVVRNMSRRPLVNLQIPNSLPLTIIDPNILANSYIGGYGFAPFAEFGPAFTGSPIDITERAFKTATSNINLAIFPDPRRVAIPPGGAMQFKIDFLYTPSRQNGLMHSMLTISGRQLSKTGFGQILEGRTNLLFSPLYGCLKVLGNPGVLNFESLEIGQEIKKEIRLKNECAESLSFGPESIEPRQVEGIGGITSELLLEPEKSGLAPGEDGKFKIVFIPKLNQVRQNISITIVGETQAGFEIHSDKIIASVIGGGPAQHEREAEGMALTKNVEIGYCDESGVTTLKIPVVGENCDSEYCDAVGMAKYLDKKISGKLKEIDSVLPNIKSTSDLENKCGSLDECYVSQLGGGQRETARVFFVNDRLTFEPFYGTESVFSSFKRILEKTKPGSILIPYEIYPVSDIEEAKEIVGRGIKGVLLFDGAFQECGAYELSVDGLIKVQKEKVGETAQINALPYVKITYVGETSSCKRRVENFPIFFPLDREIGVDEIMTLKPGTLRKKGDIKDVVLNELNTKLFGDVQRISNVERENEVALERSSETIFILKLSMKPRCGKGSCLEINDEFYKQNVDSEGENVVATEIYEFLSGLLDKEKTVFGCVTKDGLELHFLGATKIREVPEPTPGPGGISLNPLNPEQQLTGLPLDPNFAYGCYPIDWGPAVNARIAFESKSFLANNKDRVWVIKNGDIIETDPSARSPQLQNYVLTKSFNLKENEVLWVCTQMSEQKDVEDQSLKIKFLTGDIEKIKNPELFKEVEKEVEIDMFGCAVDINSFLYSICGKNRTLVLKDKDKYIVSLKKDNEISASERFKDMVKNKEAGITCKDGDIFISDKVLLEKIQEKHDKIYKETGSPVSWFFAHSAYYLDTMFDLGKPFRKTEKAPWWHSLTGIVGGALSTAGLGLTVGGPVGAIALPLVSLGGYTMWKHFAHNAIIKQMIDIQDLINTIDSGGKYLVLEIDVVKQDRGSKVLTKTPPAETYQSLTGLPAKLNKENRKRLDMCWPSVEFLKQFKADISNMEKTVERITAKETQEETSQITPTSQETSPATSHPETATGENERVYHGTVELPTD